MSGGTKASWQPQPKHLEFAKVLMLARHFGLTDYDELHRLSLEDPATYWLGVIDFLGIVWSRRPDTYVDLSRGKQFPDWFPGAELNWVDTVLAFGDDPAFSGQLAVVGEQEDGTAQLLLWPELAARVRGFASGLRARGICRGDRVGLLTENGIEATVALLGLSYVGAITIPLFSGFGVDAIVSRLAPSDAKAIIATTGFARRGRYIDMTATVLAALDQLPGVQQVIWKVAQGKRLPERGIAWDDVAAFADDGRGAERMSPSDPFMVIYTSGTTGKPKGAVHTHGGHRSGR